MNDSFDINGTARNQGKTLFRSARRGVAATELAVCLPVLILIAVATVESSAMIFLQQSLSVAAYEGARIALAPDTDAATVAYQSELILQNRGVVNGSVTVTPSNFPSAPLFSWIRVDVSSPFADNSLLGGWMFPGRTMTASVQMMKER